MTHPEWPKTEPTATDLLDYLAGRGTWCNAAMWPAMKVDRDLSDRLMHQVISAHDGYLLLDALNEIDADKANEVAALIWQAAEAGDSYGECLWEWAEKRGLDPDAITEDGNAAVDNGPDADITKEEQ